jgi:mono/diheme cytochrome c family protein
MQMNSPIARIGINRRIIAQILGPAAFAAALLLAEVIGLAMGHTEAFAASAEKGKAAFARNGCWQCHGYQGQGGVTGPRLAPDPLPFEALSAFVRTTSRAMPPYREAILPDADLEDIYAYLQSIPKGPEAGSIPLLQ